MIWKYIYLLETNERNRDENMSSCCYTEKAKPYLKQSNVVQRLMGKLPADLGFDVINNQDYIHKAYSRNCESKLCNCMIDQCLKQ